MSTIAYGDSRQNGPGRILENAYGYRLHEYHDPYGPNLIYAPQITHHEIREFPAVAFIKPPGVPKCIVNCEPVEVPTKPTPEPGYALALGLLFALCVFFRSMKWRPM
jgi:hypothetical protein